MRVLKFTVLPHFMNHLPTFIAMRSKSFSLFLCLLFLLNNCAREPEFHEKAYPFLITKEVSDITDTSVVFNAEIISTGNQSILEHGFIWDLDVPDIESAYRIALDDPATTGKISAKIDFNLYKGEVQYVRSYMQTYTHIVYGNVKSFNSNGGVPHEIHELFPDKGYENDQIVIKGDNFGTNKELISVYFGSFLAQVDSCTNTEIYFIVPELPEDQEGKIRVSIYNKDVESDVKFRGFTYWDRIANFPGGERYNSVAFSINNIGYVGLGIKSYDYFNDFYAYDPQTDTWSRMADFPGEPRANAYSGVIDNKAYVGAGTSPGFYRDLWQYDPATDTWTKMLDDTLASGFGPAHFVLNDELYIFIEREIYKYSPAKNQIVWVEHFPGQPRNYPTGLSYAGKGYIFGGSISNSRLRDLWSFDPLSKKWTKKADLPSGGRWGPAFFTVNNRIFAGLGGVATGNTLEFFEYHPSTDSWSYIGHFKSEQRALPAFFTIGDKAYVGLGTISTNNQLYDFWRFNPVKE